MPTRPAARQERRRSVRFGAYLVSVVHTGPVDTRMGGDNFGHPWRCVRLVVVLEGEVTVGFSGTTTVLGPHSAVLIVGWRKIEVSTPGAVLVEIDIAVGSTSLRGTFDDTPLTVWGPEAPLPSAVACALRELVYRPESVEAIRDVSERTVEDLVGAVVTSRPEPAPSAAAQLERNQVVAYIGAHFADLELSPSSIAGYFGVSTRTLHRLFENSGQSVSGHLADERLRNALDRLRDPRFASMTLEDIAAECGYSSALAMRRAVQAETGMTPSHMRADLMA